MGPPSGFEELIRDATSHFLFTGSVARKAETINRYVGRYMAKLDRRLDCGRVDSKALLRETVYPEMGSWCCVTRAVPHSFAAGLFISSQVVAALSI